MIIVDQTVVVTPTDDGTPDGPVPTPAAGRSFRITLTGVDGSTWDLNDGPVGLMGGVGALTAPEVGHWWQTSPANDGSRWDGMRTPRRDGIPLTFETTGPDSQTWQDVDSAFWRAIHPRDEFQLTVTAPNATSRTMWLRFLADGTSWDIDPLTAGNWATYPLEFVAANPFWCGTPVVTSFTASTPAPLFPGPPFNINRSSTTTSSTVTNPGDEPVYPRYTILGPATTWSVGVGAALVSSDTPLAAGHSVSIDMDPSVLEVLDQNGNDVYEVLDDDTFSSIPPGTDVPLSLSVTGYDTNSLVEVEFTPLYRRPW